MMFLLVVLAIIGSASAFSMKRSPMVRAKPLAMSPLVDAPLAEVATSCKYIYNIEIKKCSFIFVPYVFVTTLVHNSLIVANEIASIDDNGALTPILAFAFIATVFMGSLQDFLSQFDKPKTI